MLEVVLFAVFRVMNRFDVPLVFFSPSPVKSLPYI